MVMIDIDEIANIAVKNPKVEIVYSTSKKKFLVWDDSLEQDDTDHYCAFPHLNSYYAEAKTIFRQKYLSVFPKAPSSYSFKKWNEIINNEGIAYDWFCEIRRSLAREVTHFCQFFGLKETEATPDLYDEIVGELNVLRKRHYEKKYCDHILFHVYDGYEPVSFTILGRYGEVTGIGFYLGDFNDNTYKAVQNEYRLNTDTDTGRALSNLLSFYFETEKVDFGFSHNPFGKDGLLTSCYLNGGTMMNCYLPKSIAIRAIGFLKEANENIPLFEEKNSKDYSDVKEFYDIYLAPKEKTVIKKDISQGVEGAFDIIDHANFVDEDYEFTRAGSFDATIRTLPGLLHDETNPEHIGNFAFVVLMCDHKTGELIVNQMGVANNNRALDDVISNLSMKLTECPLPKKIYVNSYLDYVFFTDFFGPYIDKKKIKIQIEPKPLVVDEAYKGLCKFLEQRIKESETKYYA